MKTAIRGRHASRPSMSFLRPRGPDVVNVAPEPDVNAYGSKEPFTYPAPVVLAVDDSAEVRGLIRQTLGDTYSVLLACNGLEAVERLQQVHVDVVLTDLSMPEMDGLELADFVMRYYPNVRVAFVSSYLDEDTRREIARRTPFALSKPFNLPALRDTLRRVLSR